MAKFPSDQKKPGVKKSNSVVPTAKTNPPAKKSDISFPTSQGDRGVLKVQNTGIPRMVQAPTRSGDGIRNHVGAVGSIMKKMGMAT